MLHLQTSFLRHFVTLAGCVASGTLLELAAKSAKTLRDKCLCTVKVGTLISLRSASANLKAFFTAEVQAELISEAARTDLMHCKALDDWCVANDVHQELVAAADVLQEGYAATWQASMRSVAEALQNVAQSGNTQGTHSSATRTSLSSFAQTSQSIIPRLVHWLPS